LFLILLIDEHDDVKYFPVGFKSDYISGFLTMMPRLAISKG